MRVMYSRTRERRDEWYAEMACTAGEDTSSVAMTPAVLPRVRLQLGCIPSFQFQHV